MSYNTDFLIAAMIIQFIVLCHFSAQKRPDDLNNQLFLILSVLVSLDIAFEVLSTCYINFEHAGTRLGAMFTTTVFRFPKMMQTRTSVGIEEASISLGERILFARRERT